MPPAVSNPVISVSSKYQPRTDRRPHAGAASGEWSKVIRVAFGSEERANYLRGGVTFNTAYSDNVLGGDQRHTSERCELFGMADDLAR